MLLLAFFSLTGCAERPPCCQTNSSADLAVFLVESGWHTEIGIPAQSLTGRLALFRARFPGARVILFGYGKRTFMTAPTDSLSEYMLGPFPGPAVIQVSALNITPEHAFSPKDVITLPIDAAGRDHLSNQIWGDFDLDHRDLPRLVTVAPDKSSLFYAARSGYGLDHTCNGWSAEMLHAAGLPIDPHWSVFSGQVMSRAMAADTQLCSAPH